MTIRYTIVFIILLAVTGCSSQEPPQHFLKSAMRIITGVSEDQKSSVETEVLKMKPADLYSIFDRDVRGKKWEKIHENSWKIVVKAKDPVSNVKTTFEFTLVTVQQLDNDVVVKSIIINGINQDSVQIIEMMRYLDKGFANVK